MTTEKVAFSSFVGHKIQGVSLLNYLTVRFTYFNEALWAERIGQGEVILNGATATGDEVVRLGDEVRYLAMVRPEPRVPQTIPVLFEDEDLLIVNKPPHIPVHPGGRYLRNTLINILKKQRKLDLLILSHRLDRETSGVCVLTKTHLAKDKVYWQFFKSEVEKVYWALTWGRPKPASGVVDAALGTARPAQSRIRIKQVVGGADSKTARTKYHTLGTKMIKAPHWEPPPWSSLEGITGPEWPVSLVECRPQTGRTNQIRVHLGHVGAGILGDKLYDPSEEVFLEMKSIPPVMASSPPAHGYMNLPERLMRRLVLDAHALHARSLKIRHPRTGKPMWFDAEPPKSWQGLYDRPPNRRHD